ncbi:MAG: hypothetical protein WAU88_08905 [Candidatus Zixiibacteriota bacterium]
MIHVLCAFLILTVLAATGHAHSPKSSHVQLGIGSALPLGQISDHWSHGVSANFGIAFTTSPATEIVPKLEYSHLPLETTGNPNMTGSSLYTLNIGVDINIIPHKQAARVSPMLTGGIGMGRVAVAIYPYYEYAGLQRTAESNIYFSFGGGLAIYSQRTVRALFTVRSVIIQGARSSVSLLPISLSWRFL